LQSVVELVTGRDYIAGKPTSRALAAVGIIAGLLPMGKGLLKGGAKIIGAIGRTADDAVDVARVAGRVDAVVPSVRNAARNGVETVQRAMSRAELEDIQRTGTLRRGGRPGDHFVSPAVNGDADRARQRLGLPRQPEVRVTLEVPANTFTAPSRVGPFTLPDGRVLPGGGLERTAPGSLDIPVRILGVDPF